MKRLFRRKRKNPNSQEIGLRIANIFGRYFLKTDHLHYGFWPEGLPVALENLPKAQDLYTEFLRARIPEGVRSILDVGCGTGHNAEVLLAAGYEVDCVSPSPYLSSVTRSKLLDRGTLFECIFEDLPAGKKSYAVSFYLQDETKTLNDKQIDAIMQKIRKNLESKLGASLR